MLMLVLLLLVTFRKIQVCCCIYLLCAVFVVLAFNVLCIYSKRKICIPKEDMKLCLSANGAWERV